MNAARFMIFRTVAAARGGKALDRHESHALNNLLDALGVPVERPEPEVWR